MVLANLSIGEATRAHFTGVLRQGVHIGSTRLVHTIKKQTIKLKTVDLDIYPEIH